MASERIIPAAGASGVGGRVISTPFQFLTTGEDNLRVECWNSAASVTIAVDGRWIQEGRGIDAFSHRLVVTSDRTRQALDVSLGVGYVLNLVVYAAAGTPQIGQTFVRISLIRGFGAATIVLGTLLQGYVTATQALGWPGSPIEDSLRGAGALRQIVGTVAAAGAELNEVVPTGARWSLLAVFLRLFCSGAVATRTPRVVFRQSSGGTLLGVYSSVLSMVAGDSVSLTWAVGLGTPLYDPAFVPAVPLPTDTPLIAGNAFGTLTQALQAADFYQGFIYNVREWLEIA